MTLMESNDRVRHGCRDPLAHSCGLPAGAAIANGECACA